jgi:2-oxoglutarate dehydrogenase E1 component
VEESAATPAAPPGAAPAAPAPATAPEPGIEPKEFRVINLIQGYRSRGHLFTRTNPVRIRRKYSPTLALENFGLSEADLDTVFQAGTEIGIGPAPLRRIVEHLKDTYCRAIGAEFMYIRAPEKVRWLQQRMESTRNRPDFDLATKRHLLWKLSQAVVFENFLHSKFVGQKRFALSGGETLVPGLDALFEHGAAQGVGEFVLGMSHRGRLNVLANLMGKPYQDIFEEFEGKYFEDEDFTGDVKYHLGYVSTVTTRFGHPVKLNLAPNPSHLEAADPVVEGMARAKIDQDYGGDLKKLVPVLIHGDAAVAAQGVVYEVIQMSLLDGYRTGGTIHLVVNNQLGFTTNYLDGRSSTYCTDVAKVTLSPVFHVNADNVEAVALAIRMALDFRQTFGTDVFIDLLGYRRYGHNESDEPRFTQPKLYKTIARHPDPRKIYHRKLRDNGFIEPEAADEMEAAIRSTLQEELTKARTATEPHCHRQLACDRRDRPASLDFTDSPPTGVAHERLLALGRKVFQIPSEVGVFDKIRKIYDGWLSALVEKGECDWAMGEHLAYATLLTDGVPVRLSGQDCERGTFSHRHAILTVEDGTEEYAPLNHLQPGQARFEVYNSLLSEYAVLGFEYGFAFVRPQALTIWEAQFGDFANGAQIIIDQYIAAAETKWSRLNGLVLYLPHGSEGQGPEHSSARPERFLQLCAANNMVLANVTTPANLFHLLRRHMSYPVRVPLVLFTPKSLLRHPRCVSPLADFMTGGFQPVLDDTDADPQAVTRVLLCSGKIYYQLRQKQEVDGRTDVAVVRMEQLYPVAAGTLRELAARYAKATDWLWVQEEPENMGAAWFLQRKLDFLPLRLVARRESSAPATGFHEIHEIEQEEILRKAFA